jgi:NAD(P)-dependent dehydrogenase (short-subunit alcohol dehydrogenase family)
MTQGPPGVALVNGAGGGIGSAIAMAFADRGLSLGLVDRSAESIRALTGRLPPGAKYTTSCFDTSDGPSVRAFAEGLERELGPIEAMVNCTGFFPIAPYDTITDEEWDATLRSNLTAVFVSCRAVVPLMSSRGSGTVVNFSSTAGEYGSMRPSAHYAAAKGGVIALSKSLAREVSPLGVRVNVISPGPVDTPMLQATTAEARAASGARTLLGRIATPPEIAAALMFLSCDESSFITGEVLRVNGGALL